MDTHASTQLLVYFHWLLTLQVSCWWSSCKCRVGAFKWPAQLAYVRLHTINQMALVCRSWACALNTVMERGTDVPSLLFQWQRETYESAKLVGVERLVNEYPEVFRCINPASFERDCDIANSMQRWQSRRIPRHLSMKNFSIEYRAGRILHMSNIENFQCNFKIRMLSMGRTVSVPCIRRTCMRLTRSASFADDTKETHFA